MKSVFTFLSTLLFLLLPLTIEGKAFSGKEYGLMNQNSYSKEKTEIKIDSIALALFFKALDIESEQAFAHYKTERLKEPMNDFWKMSKIKALKSRQSYQITNKEDTEMFMTLDIFKMRSREVATQMIDLYCNINAEFGEVNPKLKGSKTISKEPIPYRTFCIENYIFVLDCSSEALPITENTFETFVGLNNEIPVEALNFIPAQRHYIEDEVIKAIEPTILGWLKFYGLKIEDFIGHKFVADGESEKVKLSDMVSEINAPYYTEYNKKEWDVYDPRLFDYSPNQRLYLNFLSSAGAYLDKDNKYYYFGSDENQIIYLVNRDKESIVLLKWQESAKYADAAFWIDDETCVIVGRSDSDAKAYFIECFGPIEGYYEYRTIEKRAKETYLMENLKSRGIKIEK